MDFFQAQDRARRKTKWLVLFFALAILGTIAAGYTAAILITQQVGSDSGRHDRSGNYYQTRTVAVSWWNPGIFAAVTAGTLAVVGLGSLFKWTQFHGGGAAVAESVGARRVDPTTTDLSERRLLNVVEEMAIASGVPVPGVYVLDDEPGINAFAAGLTTSDAAVTVTRGTLERLSRDELQGVIGHEFSHILNGDMRLNVKLTAIIFGILVLGLLGRGLLQGLRFSRSDRKGGGLALLLSAGLALLLIGYVGYFFGRLIQAAVSRQREFLADASAVQFTRNPGGLTGALRKIGGLAEGSVLQAAHTEQLGHFFFAQGFTSMFDSVWATHPPLEERIRALDDRWDGKFADAPAARSAAPAEEPRAARPPIPPPLAAMGPAAAIATIGTFTPDHVDYAQRLLALVPPPLREAARDPAAAPALVFALLLDAGATAREKQLSELGPLTEAETARRASELFGPIALLPAEARLPLLSLTLPALRSLPDAGLDRFSQACDALIRSDGAVTIFEFMVQKALMRHLLAARAPRAHDAPGVFSFQAVAAEISLVLSVLAGVSSPEAAAQSAAYATGARQLPLLAAQLSYAGAGTWDFPTLDAALSKLAGASGPIKQRTLLAAAHVVGADGVILPAEAQLLRAMADALGCPMPPLERAARA